MEVFTRHISKLLSFTLRAGEGGAPPTGPAAAVGKEKVKGSGSSSSSSARTDSDKDLRQGE